MIMSSHTGNVSRGEAIGQSIRESSEVMASLADQSDAIETICNVVIAALQDGKKLMTAGNGGSAADALHMSEEFVGRFRTDRRPLPCIALVADTTLLTCIANDFGYEHIFDRQVESLGQPGDIYIVFSTSGNGEHFRLSVEAARSKGITTIGFLGKGGGLIADMLDHKVVVASSSTARIQEAHTLLLHMVLEQVEEVFGLR